MLYIKWYTSAPVFFKRHLLKMPEQRLHTLPSLPILAFMFLTHKVESKEEERELELPKPVPWKRTPEDDCHQI